MAIISVLNPITKSNNNHKCKNNTQMGFHSVNQYRMYLLSMENECIFTSMLVSAK